ncbi:MAG: alpha/beta hydrolase fold domain-containing protein [Candidatus Hydrogenedens sp.]|nr:alpha/beta hydrolase fold domain-containing protein [Candidatus Hydrogenedens sp.]
MRMTRLLLVASVALMLGACARGLHVERGSVFAEPEGATLRMNLYQPEGDATGLRPGMVLIHGGGWVAGRRTQQAWYAREFARAGYVVLACDYRMMPHHAFPACVEDAKAAVRWLRLHADEYQIDPEHIVAFGASAGGHIAGMLAATRPDDGFEGDTNPGASSAVEAAVILYGAVDLTSYRDGAAGKAGIRFVGEFAGREFKKNPKRDQTDAYEWASPVTYVHPGMPPVHLSHGTRDALVATEQSKHFYQRLQEAGVPSELTLYENRNHGFDFMFPDERREIFVDMLDFLDEHGIPRTPPRP